MRCPYETSITMVVTVRLLICASRADEEAWADAQLGHHPGSSWSKEAVPPRRLFQRPSDRLLQSISVATCTAQRDGPHLPRTDSTSSLGIRGMSPSVSCSVDCSLDSGRLVISPLTACHVRDNGGSKAPRLLLPFRTGTSTKDKGASRAAEGQCAGGDGSTKAPLFLVRSAL